ncbi:MAG: fructose-specific PTS transporter subunit EIIC [Mycoplasmoidaceae bacterium]
MKSNFFKKDLVILNKNLKSKDECLEFFAKILKDKGYGKSSKTILSKALEREGQFSTGIGEHIAIPHIRDDVMKEPVILFAKVNDIDWGSVDNKKVKYIFFICMNKQEGENSHMNIIASLSKLFLNEKFVKDLDNVKDYKSLISSIEKYSESKEEIKEEKDFKGSYDIVAVTACPTGVAHTFLSAEVLNKTAKEMNLKIKVETQGTEGSKNTLTQDEIDNAKGVILALDRAIDRDRFIGIKNVVDVSTRAVIKDPKKEINKVLNNEGKEIKGVRNTSNKTTFNETNNLVSFDNWWKRTYQGIMSGVSHMLPFVIFGGIMIAIAFMIDSFGANSTNAGNLGSILPTSRWFKGIGDLAFGLIVPILSAYMAFALVGKGGLLPGFICGMISNGAFTNNGVPWLMPSIEDLGGQVHPDQLKAGSGFFGAIGGAIVTGLMFVVITKYILDYLPTKLNAIKNILIMPLFGTLIIVVIFFFLNIPLQFVNLGFGMFLDLFAGMPELYPLLGLIMGIMMCSDLGGPINKAAYVFGTITLTGPSAGTSGSIPMAIAMGAGMIPPLGIALSCTFNKKLWTEKQRKEGVLNYIMGLSFITEGAIPFTAEQPRKLIISNLIGGAVAGIAIGSLQIGLLAPHGGIFVAPLLRCQLFNTPELELGLGIALFLGAILLGSLASMISIYLISKFTKFGKNKQLESSQV